MTPRAGILLGNPERRPFGVDVTSEGRVAAQAQAALVQVPRLPPWAPMAAAGALALAVLAVASVAFGVLPPKPAPTPPPAAQSPGCVGRRGRRRLAHAHDRRVTTPRRSPRPHRRPSRRRTRPRDAPTATPTEPPSESPTLPPDACVSGYVWRQLIDGDHVCVTDATFAQIQADNAAAPTRWMDGAYGPHTCIAGYVWRDAFSGDDVCVTGDIRTTTALDNQAGPLRIAPRTDACVAGLRLPRGGAGGPRLRRSRGPPPGRRRQPPRADALDPRRVRGPHLCLRVRVARGVLGRRRLRHGRRPEPGAQRQPGGTLAGRPALTGRPRRQVSGTMTRKLPSRPG